MVVCYLVIHNYYVDKKLKVDWSSFEGIGIICFFVFTLVYFLTLLVQVLFWTYHISNIIEEDLEIINDKKLYLLS